LLFSFQNIHKKLDKFTNVPYNNYYRITVTISQAKLFLICSKFTSQLLLSFSHTIIGKSKSQIPLQKYDPFDFVSNLISFSCFLQLLGWPLNAPCNNFVSKLVTIINAFLSSIACLYLPTVSVSLEGLSVSLCLSLSVYLSIFLSICLSVYLPICLSVCLSVCLSDCSRMSNR